MGLSISRVLLFHPLLAQIRFWVLTFCHSGPRRF